MRILRDLLIITALFVGAWMAFTYFSESSESNTFLGKEKEEELGGYLRDFVMQRYDSIYSPYTDSVLMVIRDRLVGKLDTVGYQHKLHIIKSSEINAFASLGGNIFIFTGLIEHVSGPEELAAVMAHEIAHSEKRHVVKHLIREIGINSLFMILTGGDQVLMEQVGKMVISSSFSRDFEREADELAVLMMADANLNPNRLAHFFSKLQEKGKSSPDALTWVSSHPSLKERIERVLSKSKDMELAEEVPFAFDWERFVQACK
jgi:beta-barrel assembly-enhancing protease